MWVGVFNVQLLLCMKMCVKELTLNAKLLCVSVWVHIRAYVGLSVCVCVCVCVFT
jgi:hypothetical protein